jgi:hypothetical protein
MGSPAKAVAAALGALALGALAAPGLPRFSALAPGGAITGWSVLRPAPKAPDTYYSLVSVDGQTVVKAEAQASMSGLVYRFDPPLANAQRLSWRWRIAGVPLKGDLRTKAGDDYAARVYVLFDYPRARLPLLTRTQLALAEAFYGQPLPTAAINYVWDNRAPLGTVLPNAYTDRARMMVLQSGSARVGQWVSETRDLAADFRAAFGEAPPPITGIAIATDSDNTGETLTAWYGDLTLE